MHWRYSILGLNKIKIWGLILYKIMDQKINKSIINLTSFKTLKSENLKIDYILFYITDSVNLDLVVKSLDKNFGFTLILQWRGKKGIQYLIVGC